MKILAATSRIARTWAVTACVSVVAVSCQGLSSSGSYPSECPSTSCQTLTDTSAGHLSLFVDLTQESSIPSVTHIRVEFEVPQGGKSVDFVAGEQVSCDGVAFKRFPGAFGRDVLTASIAGRTVNCVYTSGERSTPFGFSVPLQIEILTPVNHQSVRRGPQTTVTYKNRVVYPGGLRLQVVAANNSGQHSGALPDAVTMTSAVVDTSRLQTGAGFIQIAEAQLPIDVQGAKFQSAGGQETETAIVFVMWV
jgi:hypothetical protein